MKIRQPIAKRRLSREHNGYVRHAKTTKKRNSMYLPRELTNENHDQAQSEEIKNQNFDLLICTGGYIKENNQKINKAKTRLINSKIPELTTQKELDKVFNTKISNSNVLLIFEINSEIKITIEDNFTNRNLLSKIQLYRFSPQKELLAKRSKDSGNQKAEILPPRFKLYFNETESNFIKFNQDWFKQVLTYCRFNSLDVLSVSEKSFSLKEENGCKLNSLFELKNLPLTIIEQYFTKDEVRILNISIKKFYEVINCAVELYNENKDEEDLVDTLYRIINLAKKFLQGSNITSEQSANNTVRYKSLKSKKFSEDAKSPSDFTFKLFDGAELAGTKRKLSLFCLQGNSAEKMEKLSNNSDYKKIGILSSNSNPKLQSLEAGFWDSKSQDEERSDNSISEDELKLKYDFSNATFGRANNHELRLQYDFSNATFGRANNPKKVGKNIFAEIGQGDDQNSQSISLGEKELIIFETEREQSDQSSLKSAEFNQMDSFNFENGELESREAFKSRKPRKSFFEFNTKSSKFKEIQKNFKENDENFNKTFFIVKKKLLFLNLEDFDGNYIEYGQKVDLAILRAFNKARKNNSEIKNIVKVTQKKLEKIFTFNEKSKKEIKKINELGVACSFWLKKKLEIVLDSTLVDKMLSEEIEIKPFQDFVSHKDVIKLLEDIVLYHDKSLTDFPKVSLKFTFK